MLRATTISLQQPRRMASIFAKIQDKGTSLLFGKDGGTGKSIFIAKGYSHHLFIFFAHMRMCADDDVSILCLSIAVWHCNTVYHLDRSINMNY